MEVCLTSGRGKESENGALLLAAKAAFAKVCARACAYPCVLCICVVVSVAAVLHSGQVYTMRACRRRHGAPLSSLPPSRCAPREDVSRRAAQREHGGG
jgi:hypothetical protein